MVVAIAVVTGLVTAVPAAVSAPGPDLSHPYRSGYVMVGYRDGVSPTARAEVRGQAGVALSRALLPSADLLRLPTGLDVATAIARLQRDPRVEYAEPDYILQATATSNDPYYTNGSLWGMYGDATATTNAFGSQAGEAWAAGYTGSSSVVIGVIDEGIDITHPDLAANIWVNPGESGLDGSGRDKRTNGVDDDANGYIDDVNGWDFYSNNKTVFDGSADDHGTHVAGTIGGKGGNGVGVAGVNWDVTLISAKFLGTNGGSTSDAILALRYLTALKTRATDPVNIVATSNSWGGGGYSDTLRNAIIAAGNVGMLFIVAAGNSSYNLETKPQYPAAYTCPTTAGFDCMITVASLDSNGARSSFSNYGSRSVDLGAPGRGIYSTLPGNTYNAYSGTSMATPHVSGAVALCASIGPDLTPAELRNAVLSTVAPTASMVGVTTTGGRLDIGAMVAACSATPEPVTTSSLSVSVSGLGTVTGGGISCGNGATTCTVEASGNVTLSAVAASGQQFLGWSGCDVTGTASCTVAMTSDRTVSATFIAATYSARLSISKPSRTYPSVTISTSGGAVSWNTTCSSTSCSAPSGLSLGTVITFRANFAGGASRVSWSGCDSTTSSTCTVTVNGSESVTAKFAK